MRWVSTTRLRPRAGPGAAVLVGAVLLALLTLSGCGDPEKAAFRAPVLSDLNWQNLVPIVGDFGRLGGRFDGRFELARFQGYRYAAAAGARIRLDLRRQSGHGDPVLLLYGPRSLAGVWGQPRAQDDDGGVGDSALIVSDALPGGTYLIVVTTREERAVGDYLVALTCLEGCDLPPVCPLAPDCGREICYSGFLTDDNGCPTCDCADECAGNGHCGPDEVCVLGQCEPRCGCRDPFDPVCGANGRTYPNACEARCAGVDVLSTGECRADCEDLVCNLDCPSGYRRNADGCEMCACLDPCEACSRRVAPVCTLNDRTYLNTCLALCEGEVPAYSGACRLDCSDARDCGLSCPGGFVRDDDGCPLCECLDEPCPVADLPVCGEDGVTYGTACEAEQAGVAVLFTGACPPLCHGNTDCPTGQVCVSGQYGLPACSTADLDCPSACALSPQRCTVAADCERGDVCGDGGQCRSPCDCHPLYQPVCGDDGNTWQNACRARCANVAIESWGPCCDSAVISDCDLSCPGGYVVDENGCDLCECAGRDDCLCGDIDNPVCGADGTTYANACERRCAGVGAADDPAVCPASSLTPGGL